ncbi:LuxR C-terminal-related transcriptional regulator [Streptomyces sp. NPDC101237]|uniref:helix-turn-helix transcriptional regulator n=1 Tax=Streptomyces sp. NPDC101237 TaxID=3366139 RepID=UPI00380E0A3D
MTSSVPAFRVRPPAQPPHVLSRPRLLHRLDTATEPVVVLCAPAGAGKTVLLTEWARGPAAGGACAWLGLDARDNTPERLWAGIAHAVHQLRADLPRLDEGAWTAESWFDETLPALLTALAAAGPLTLVLDGLEAVTDAGTWRTLGDFLTRLPPGVRVVLSTRHRPGAPLPALSARGLVAELDLQDLAFTREEARAVLTALLCTAPGAADVHALYEATEGWAAGLCLMGRALARSGTTARAAAWPARGRQAVTAYLTTEVLDRLTTEQRRFLLRTSVLAELGAGACQALAGDRAGVVLDDLARTVQLLVPVGAETSAYRHHRALAALLSDVLAAEEADSVAALHKAAARWYARQGRTTEAVRHWTLGGDEPEAVAAVLDGWEKEISAGHGARVALWLDALSRRTVAADARLCVVAAMTALADGAPAAACRWLDVALLRATGEQSLGESGTVGDAAAAARAVARCLQGEVLDAGRLGGSAVAGNPPLTSWRALAATARGTALLWTGRYAEAEALLGEATRDAHACGHGLALVRALGLRTVCALLAGQRGPARALSDEAHREIAATGLARHFVSVPAYLGRAGLLLGADRLDEAEQALAAAEAVLADPARTAGEPHVRALCHALRSRLEHARHDTEAARAARGAAQRAAAACETPGILTGLLGRAGGHRPAAPPAVPRPQDLSAGERRVLRALCGSLTLREIACELYVSHNTVKTQVRAIFRKLGAHDRTEAVTRARECGLL